MFYVYYIQNLLNNKIYVGKTNDLKSRFNNHVTYANGGKEKYPQHFSFIHAAIRKNGKENFIFDYIEEFENERDAFEAENFWIEFFNSNNKYIGYNLTIGGEGSSGRIVSQETKDKIAQKATGRLHSEESKKKISNAGKLRSNSQETRNKISKSNKGRKLTDTQILANSLRQIGKKLPQSQIENMKKSAKRGENNSKSKLSNQQVIEIRILFKTGKYKIKELAKLFNVSASCMSGVINYKTYIM